jgi:molybdenum cofactor cytidylyltransferase
MASENIFSILLAAGSSRRFGKDKLLQPLSNNKTVVASTVENLKNASPNIITVIRPDHAQLETELQALDIRIVVNQHASSGMASSIVAGILASQEADGWIIALADMPWVKQETICRIKEKLLQGKSIVVPVYENRRGNPVGFSKYWKEELLKLSGDRGARDLLAKNSENLSMLNTDDQAILKDIDYPGDLYLT